MLRTQWGIPKDPEKSPPTEALDERGVLQPPGDKGTKDLNAATSLETRGQGTPGVNLGSNRDTKSPAQSTRGETDAIRRAAQLRAAYGVLVEKKQVVVVSGPAGSGKGSPGC